MSRPEHGTQCHVCLVPNSTKLKEFIHCGGCTKIFCRSCFSSGNWEEGPSWQEAKRNSADWLCPACLGICKCDRCQAQKEHDYHVRMKNPSSRPWSFNAFAPLKTRRISIPSEYASERLAELKSREQFCDEKIEQIQKLLLLMRKEREELIRNRELLDSKIREQVGSMS